MHDDEKYITLDNEEHFEKIVTQHGIAYRPKNYPGPIAIDATIAKKDDIGLNINLNLKI